MVRCSKACERSEGSPLRQAAADIGIAVETLRRLEQGKPAHAGTANPVARFYDADPSELFVMETIDPQLGLLEAVLGTLDVDGLRRAANSVGIRAIAAGNGAERELFKNMADELEREADRRSPGFGDADVLDVEPEPRDTQWVESLPEWLRGVSFNMHGEALVYTTDDYLLHSDMDWQPMRVRDGVAQGLVLDCGEERFVAGMWALNEYARRKRVAPVATRAADRTTPALALPVRLRVVVLDALMFSIGEVHPDQVHGVHAAGRPLPHAPPSQLGLPLPPAVAISLVLRAADLHERRAKRPGPVRDPHGTRFRFDVTRGNRTGVMDPFLGWTDRHLGPELVPGEASPPSTATTRCGHAFASHRSQPGSTTSLCRRRPNLVLSRPR